MKATLISLAILLVTLDNFLITRIIIEHAYHPNQVHCRPGSYCIQ